MVVMTERRDQLVRIAEDLEKYIQAFCPCPHDKPTDFAGEKCNDAFLMLQEALSNLTEDSKEDS